MSGCEVLVGRSVRKSCSVSCSAMNRCTVSTRSCCASTACTAVAGQKPQRRSGRLVRLAGVPPPQEL
jgi:hypothetical protein